MGYGMVQNGGYRGRMMMPGQIGELLSRDLFPKKRGPKGPRKHNYTRRLK